MLANQRQSRAGHDFATSPLCLGKKISHPVPRLAHDIYYTAECFWCITPSRHHQSMAACQDNNQSPPSPSWRRCVLFLQPALNSSPLSSHSSPLSAFLLQHMSFCLHRGVLHNQPTMHLYPSLANSWLVGLFTTHRVVRKQARGCVSKTAVKTPTEMHILNALYTCPKNAPKTQITSVYPTS